MTLKNKGKIDQPRIYSPLKPKKFYKLKIILFEKKTESPWVL